MKLALIEDRIPRMKQFLDFKIEEFPFLEIISDIKLNALRSDIESNNFNKLTEFDCIATHRSAWTVAERNRLMIFCRANSKTLIYFSGGITSSTFKDAQIPFLLINSKEFYSTNLKTFLEYSRTNNKLELSILQFGKKWQLNLLMDLRNRLMVFLNLNEIKDVKLAKTENITRVIDLRLNQSLKNTFLKEVDLNIDFENDYAKIDSSQVKKLKTEIDKKIFTEI